MNLKAFLVLLLVLQMNMSTPSIDYKKIESPVSDLPLVIHMLKVNMNNQFVHVRNGLSKGVIYGFEETSSMAKEAGVDIAINGTFFDDYGHHVGGMMIDGEWLTMPDPSLPTIMIDDNNKVSIGKLESKSFISYADNQKVFIDGMNRYAYGDELLLFTSDHGKTTRVYDAATNYVIENGKVITITVSSKPLEIGKDAYVIVDVGSSRELNLVVGSDVTIGFTESDNLSQVFQTSSYLVQGGQVVAKDFDPIVGLMTNREPRTIMGVTEDNEMIFLVVEGRRPGVSIGITGQEAGEIMQFLGCTDAVLLDGGASSTLVYNGDVKNKLIKDKERTVAHSLLFESDS